MAVNNPLEQPRSRDLVSVLDDAHQSAKACVQLVCGIPIWVDGAFAFHDGEHEDGEDLARSEASLFNIFAEVERQRRILQRLRVGGHIAHLGKLAKPGPIRYPWGQQVFATHHEATAAFVEVFFNSVLPDHDSSPDWVPLGALEDEIIERAVESIDDAVCVLEPMSMAIADSTRESYFRNVVLPNIKAYDLSPCTELVVSLDDEHERARMAIGSSNLMSAVDIAIKNRIPSNRIQAFVKTLHRAHKKKLRDGGLADDDWFDVPYAAKRNSAATRLYLPTSPRVMKIVQKYQQDQF